MAMGRGESFFAGFGAPRRVCFCIRSRIEESAVSVFGVVRGESFFAGFGAPRRVWFCVRSRIEESAVSVFGGGERRILFRRVVIISPVLFLHQIADRGIRAIGVC